jgi:LysM repeat protein
MSVRSSALFRVAVLLTVAVTALFLLLANGVQAGSELRPTIEHVVRSGETLWEIATAHTAAGADVRDTIRDIKSMSGLDGSLVYPGDRLVVPVLEG